MKQMVSSEHTGQDSSDKLNMCPVRVSAPLWNRKGGHLIKMGQEDIEPMFRGSIKYLPISGYKKIVQALGMAIKIKLYTFKIQLLSTGI